MKNLHDIGKDIKLASIFSSYEKYEKFMKSLKDYDIAVNNLKISNTTYFTTATNTTFTVKLDDNK